MKYFLSAFILLSILVGAFAQTGPQIASYFREHLSPTSTLYIPSQVNYTLLTTQRWNAFSEPTYIVSVKPATDLDVQKIVRLLLHSRRSPFPQSYQPTSLTVRDTARVCLSAQHLISRYRRWARLLRKSGYSSERD